MRSVNLAGLPDDVLHCILAQLSQDDFADATTIDSLARACRALRIVVSTSSAWDLLIAKLGLMQVDVCGPSRAICLAAARACACVRATSIASLEPGVGSTAIHLVMADGHRHAAFFDELQQLGLACSVSSEDALCWIPPFPFVAVHLDVARADRPLTDPMTGHLRTYPCAHVGCMDPAAYGCRHCRKHAGRGANRLVEQCVQEEHVRTPRLILLVAPTPAVRDAYRRALVLHRRGSCRRDRISPMVTRRA